ncbi:MAG: hypothetical protein ABSG27_08415 [Candidatus Acidiferrales bacterium]|jgi:hypothetical protein
MLKSQAQTEWLIPKDAEVPTLPRPEGIPRDMLANADSYEGESTYPLVGTGPQPAGRVDHGPCLYLGPVGQRCDKRALAGGFCAKHRPGGMPQAIRNPARVLAAAIAIVALLWPYIHDVLREIIRWMQTR